MGEDQSKPKLVEPEKRKGEPAPKLEQWLGIKDDGGDLYLDAMKRPLRGKTLKKD